MERLPTGMESPAAVRASSAAPRSRPPKTAIRPSGHRPAAGATATIVTVVMPTTDFEPTFARCAARVIESLRPDLGDHFVVVFDGAEPTAPRWLEDAGAVVLSTGRRSGPAVARNLGAESARGDVVVFVDADVELAADALERFRRAFDDDPDLCGIFGAYDKIGRAHV